MPKETNEMRGLLDAYQILIEFKNSKKWSEILKESRIRQITALLERCLHRVETRSEKPSEDGGREELRLFCLSRPSKSMSLSYRALMIPFASSSDSALGAAVVLF